MPSAQASADRMVTVVAYYRGLAGGTGADYPEVLANLLADLHHWSDLSDVDWDEAVSDAEQHYAKDAITQPEASCSE